MKKFWKYLAISAIAVGAMPMVSCSDDDAVDPYELNYCYMYQPNSTYAQLEYKANGEFLIDIDDPMTLMPVRLTKPAPADLSVTVSIDESLVDEYNKANGTDYEFLTGCSIVNPTLTIKAGEYVSTKTITTNVPDPSDETGEATMDETKVVYDSVVVSFGTHENFQTGHPNLMLPVVISSVDNSGVTISKSSRIFLTFTSDYKANIISFDYLSYVNIDDATENWETAYTNVDLKNLFNCQWAADDAIAISAELGDDALVTAYNEANATNYLPLPGTKIVSNTINIAKGESVGSLQLSLGDYSGVNEETCYLVPVNLDIVSGQGAELQSKLAYVLVRPLPLYVTAYTNSTPYDVTMIPNTSDWSATYTSPEGDQDNYDAILTPTSYSNKAFRTGGLLEVDLGKEYDVDMFMVRYGAYYYANSEILDVETSLDGITWSNWGAAEFSDFGYSTAVAYIEFCKPAKFRYIRFTSGEEYYPISSYYYPRLRHVQFYTK